MTSRVFLGMLTPSSNTVLEPVTTAMISGLPEVTAHEFFHLWNVKRIRPQSLEPIDYTRENYSRALCQRQLPSRRTPRC